MGENEVRESFSALSSASFVQFFSEKGLMRSPISTSMSAGQSWGSFTDMARSNVMEIGRPMVETMTLADDRFRPEIDPVGCEMIVSRNAWYLPVKVATEWLVALS